MEWDSAVDLRLQTTTTTTTSTTPTTTTTFVSLKSYRYRSRLNQPTTQYYENEIDNKYTVKILGRNFQPASGRSRVGFLLRVRKYFREFSSCTYYLDL